MFQSFPILYDISAFISRADRWNRPGSLEDVCFWNFSTADSGNPPRGVGGGGPHGEILENSEKRLQLLNGWETPPQTYIHLKEGIQGFQKPVSDFPESAWASRKVGFSEEWGPIFGVKSSKTAYLKNRFFAPNFHQTQKYEKVCFFF